MEVININNLLERQEEVAKMKDILTNFEKTKHNLTTKKGIYIYSFRSFIYYDRYYNYNNRRKKQ